MGHSLLNGGIHSLRRAVLFFLILFTNTPPLSILPDAAPEWVAIYYTRDSVAAVKTKELACSNLRRSTGAITLYYPYIY